jgi:hypothetical protein
MCRPLLLLLFVALVMVFGWKYGYFVKGEDEWQGDFFDGAVIATIVQML